ncbi:hypothetical protein PSCLAVI8L_100179 [Pseudoclavibacter sp. 8L]|nr:hypothetical protein PSCLAVI8L_100179 [Pseudoclavibacter sp. 8L]
MDLAGNGEVFAGGYSGRPGRVGLVSSSDSTDRPLKMTASSTASIGPTESGAVTDAAGTVALRAATFSCALRSAGDIGFVFLWFDIPGPREVTDSSRT